MARLITSLYSTKTLHQAWKAVKQKNSAGGIDGLTVEEYEADLGNNLRELQLELKNKSWRPEPYFRIEIKKKKTEGERRKLGLLTIKDKIVQQAIKSLIEQRFENLFLNNSYGYRPDKGHTRAIKRSLSELKNKKNQWILKLDIDNYFDTINHELLFSRLKSVIPDEEVLRLIELCVQIGAVNKNVKWEDTKQGVPQGAVLSPILANFYLHPFDQFITSKTGGYVRYADDFIILCESQEQAQELLAQGMEFLTKRLLLFCNPPEIKSVEEGVSFLGVIIHPSGVSISPEKYATLCARINDLTLDGVSLSSKSLESLDGIRRYYGVLLPESYLLDLDSVLLKKMTELLEAHTTEFKNKDVVKNCFRNVEFFAGKNILLKKQILEELINKYLQIKRDKIKPPSSEEVNKRLISQKKREYRKREGECSELVVSQIGSYISVNKKGITVKQKGITLLEAPTAALQHITVMTEAANISAGAVKYCMQNKIPVDFFDGHGKLYGSVLSPAFMGCTLWEKQALLEREKRAFLACKIISGKLKNQQNLIKYFHKYHKGAVGVLAEQYAVSIKAIDEQLAAIKKVDGTTEEYREKLIAIEAGAAVAYWEYIRVLIEDDNMEFETRERKGAKDLMNSLLNYGYAILYARVWQALLLVKLNPAESIIHVKQPGKPTFVYDVIELFRAQAVDRVVIALIQKKEPLELEKGLLSNETKGLLIQNILERLNRYEKYRGEEIRFTDILIRQAREIAAYIIEEASNYKPYLAKW